MPVDGVTTDQLPEPKGIRGLLSVVLGASLGGSIGVLEYIWAGLPWQRGARNGCAIGVVVGVLDGILVWALFPYRSRESRIDASAQTSQEIRAGDPARSAECKT